MSGARGTLVLPHASAARGDAAPPLEGGTTPQTLRASGGDSAAAPTVQQQAVEVHPTTQGQLQATPLHRAAPSRWANAASAARAAVTPRSVKTRCSTLAGGSNLSLVPRVCSAGPRHVDGLFSHTHE